jgi:hypothetical protein
MNKANLKSYAPKARLDFIAAITARANLLGISAGGALPADVSGDVVIIDGREWPAKLSAQRDELIARIKRRGFEQTMDEVAYTWFNRFAALRFMEIHGYLDHGWRVLSSRDGGLPEILRHASEVSLPGLNAARAREMQLAGDRDNELYRLLLVAQCNELSRSMPFLFERIDDETELLLPENLLRTDSIVSKLVVAVPEEDWRQIEVIGWLYQFYIADEKDRIDRKLKTGGSVESREIPAKTQLFTPNWIVQYLVQNSIGRIWLMAHPNSKLASQWPYYVHTVKQTEAAQARAAAVIHARMIENGGNLNPETLTIVDPACGSGHILVVAYDVLRSIYLEQGYQPRAIARLILEKNLFGLDIDDRAAQLAAFALIMKARADDRRVLVDPPKIQIVALQDSKWLNLDELAIRLKPFGIKREALNELLVIFRDAKALGSLLRIPESVSTQLHGLQDGLGQALNSGDLYARAAAQDVMPLLRQAQLLNARFDSVVANPPYMGGKGMNSEVKAYASNAYPNGKSDMFAMFIERCLELCKGTGFTSMVTMQSWMFFSSYELLRTKILNERTVHSLVQIGYNSFPEINSKIALACAFSIGAERIRAFKSQFIDLNSAPQSADKGEVFRNRTQGITYDIDQDDLSKVAGWPLAYWLPEQAISAFSEQVLGDVGKTRRGLQTGDKERFIRFWYECNIDSIERSYLPRERAIQSPAKWFMFNNGGDFRKWYGNLDLVVNWERNGAQLKSFARAIIPSEELYFEPAVSWSRLTSGENAFRSHPQGVIPGDLSPCYYSGDIDLQIAYLNSKCASYFLNAVNPSITAPVGDVAKIPVPRLSIQQESILRERVKSLIDVHRNDWDSLETSWDFEAHPLITNHGKTKSLSSAWAAWQERSESTSKVALSLEQENNETFIQAFGLHDYLSPDVPIEQITLLRADREKDCQRLVSYAIGCMMGRYSLDKTGLIYAGAGNIGFDSARYFEFAADSDGIVPLTDERWFEDDAACRVHEFLRAVWGAETLEENLVWLSESLGNKGSETPDESVRRYLADKFFRYHLQTYKKRPIYWLFSSGKQGAFQALVYMHRYHEGTLARLRAEYVVPLFAKFIARLEMLDRDAVAASSAAARTKIQKQSESLRKKQVELLAYDDKLRHYADMRIALDLDDGVKVNYGKFGDLVAEPMAITGGTDD